MAPVYTVLAQMMADSCLAKSSRAAPVSPLLRSNLLAEFMIVDVGGDTCVVNVVPCKRVCEREWDSITSETKLRFGVPIALQGRSPRDGENPFCHPRSNLIGLIWSDVQ